MTQSSADSADYVSGGQGVKGPKSASCLLISLFWWRKSGDRSLRLCCGEAAQTPLKHSGVFAGPPSACPRFSVMSIRFTEHDKGDWAPVSKLQER